MNIPHLNDIIINWFKIKEMAYQEFQSKKLIRFQ